MNVVGHDHKGMQAKTALIAIAEKSRDHHHRVRGAPTDALATIDKDGDCVDYWLEAHRLLEREHTPGAKAYVCRRGQRPKAEALGYLRYNCNTDLQKFDAEALVYLRIECRDQEA